MLNLPLRRAAKEGASRKRAGTHQGRAPLVAAEATPPLKILR